jgi:hypothetical protein
MEIWWESQKRPLGNLGVGRRIILTLIFEYWKILWMDISKIKP